MSNFDGKTGNEGFEARLERWLDEQERRREQRLRYLRNTLYGFGIVMLYVLLLAALKTITDATWWAVATNAAVTTVFMLSTVRGELRARQNREPSPRVPSDEGGKGDRDVA